MLVSSVHQSDSVMCVFFSDSYPVGYCKVLNLAPCVTVGPPGLTYFLDSIPCFASLGLPHKGQIPDLEGMPRDG